MPFHAVSDSARIFFLISKMRKDIEKTYLILHGWEVENKTKHTLRYKMWTKHYGLGIHVHVQYGLRYKTCTTHYRLGIKHEERYKIPISYQVIMVH